MKRWKHFSPDSWNTLRYLGLVWTSLNIAWVKHTMTWYTLIVLYPTCQSFDMLNIKKVLQFSYLKDQNVTKFYFYTNSIFMSTEHDVDTSWTKTGCQADMEHGKKTLCNQTNLCECLYERSKLQIWTNEQSTKYRFIYILKGLHY